MYNDNDNSLGGFLGLVLLGASFFAGKKVGQNQVIQAINDQRRDEEIADLKRQIEYMKRERV